MSKQQGFTLIELMVVIGIIAILSTVGMPAYQNYLRKAALTDMLQTAVSYRTAIEVCAINRGSISRCDAGSNGIPSSIITRYISSMNITAGVITLTGQETVNGLTITLTPKWDNARGVESWARACNVVNNGSLKQACEAVFRFGSEDTGTQ